MSDVAGERRAAYYSGRVQGVGFRYTVRALAGRFSVTGFVKNLPDGRVQLVVEGSPDELDRFQASIDAELGHYVSDTRQTEGPAVGEFSCFEIRF